VRPLLIEGRDELIEPSLLLQEVPGGWFGGFILQCQMYPLVANALSGAPA
jgi:hypothetical protein